ncbi:endonuclease/exonuclease/phosphatase family protein [Coleofasciculus sp. F4-SAH-05]|uniref:endonuclease/exonuclease/phosphatase family protein n=1 Tax=Coleofasciculus sp. F4-SAH-05 TaxID=3069525 RepID=UPI0032F6EF28
MKAAFWNINMGKTSPPNRINTFQKWCADMKPDLLLLEEVSETLRDDMETLTGMQKLNYVNTLDKNGNTTTKQLWALEKARQPLPFEARALRFPGLEQKRLLLKVTRKTGIPGNAFELWVIHANASAAGGAAATKAVNDHLNSTAGKGAIVGGDFNYAIASAGGNAIHPHSWQTKAGQVQLKFTQWNKVAGSTQGPNDNLHIEKSGTVIYQQVQPHNIIDYVMKGANRNAVAQNNCIGVTPAPENMWIDILREFDHCPVVYDIT